MKVFVFAFLTLLFTFSFGGFTPFTPSAFAICAAPDGLSVTNIQAGSVMLQWNVVSSAVNYTLRYRKQGAPNWLSLTVQGNYRSLAGLSADATYEWRVRANCINFGAGPFSDGTSFMPDGGVPSCAPPTGLTEISESWSVISQEMMFKWNAQVGVSQYIFQFRALAGGPWITRTTAETFIKIRYLAPGAFYSVRVKAVCVQNYETEWSFIHSFETPNIVSTNACISPRWFYSVNVQPHSALLKWGIGTGAKRYVIQHKPKNEFSWKTIYCVSGNQISFDSLTPGVTYEVKVRSYCTPFTPTLPCITTNPTYSAFVITEFSTPIGKVSSTDTDILSSEANETFALYPNPNKGNFTLRFVSTEESNVKITVIDATGREVYTQQSQAQKGENEVYLETNLARGLYLLHVGSYSGKVVIE